MVQDRFSKFLGKLRVEIEGEEPLELDMKLKDKHKIMSIMSKFAGSPSEEHFDQLSTVFMEVLKRSYPEIDEAALNAFLIQKFEALMTGVSIAFGWTTKAELERRMKEKNLQTQ